MPTTETSGALPGEQTSGAGALPGPVSEPGVAVLPEERPVEANNPQVVTSTMESSGGETGAALLTDEKRLRGDDTTGKLPSKDVKGGWPMRGAQGGIGTLSWAGSDSSIAVLPDEKNTTNGSPKGTSGTPEVSFPGDFPSVVGSRFYLSRVGGLRTHYSLAYTLSSWQRSNLEWCPARRSLSTRI
jgi:hypothetical protein